MTQLDAAIAPIASRQHGAFHRSQALGAGFDYRAITRRIRSGRWLEAARYVYVLPGTPNTWRQKLMIAVLEAGSGTVASHRSAAALLRIPEFAEGPIHVTTKRGGAHRLTKGVLHETFWLPPEHTTVVDNIPCSSLARCIFQLAGTEHPRRVDRALNNSQRDLGLSLDRMAEVVATVGRRGVPGTTLMRELLDARGPGYVPTESELEDLFFSVLESYGMELPARQVRAGGDTPVGRIDYIYREAKLLIECDSRRYHTQILDWEAGVARRAKLVAAGWRVIEVTWYRLVHEPEQVVAEIRDALRAAA